MCLTPGGAQGHQEEHRDTRRSTGTAGGAQRQQEEHRDTRRNTGTAGGAQGQQEEHRDSRRSTGALQSLGCSLLCPGTSAASPRGAERPDPRGAKVEMKRSSVGKRVAEAPPPEKSSWLRQFCGRGFFREIWKNRFVILRQEQLLICHQGVVRWTRDRCVGGERGRKKEGELERREMEGGMEEER
uniref:Uncharacterized protein n=1 Tax=Knipowitschia caucasica TaxID=637954 RepID=A0AAV2ME56_KNICA